ncbi:hypothetical protein JI435_422650 [Parastagonospora nodorum SN15]|uniref:Uncharacterized protein n=1 Tax=Phaeosphaeria nodorum (strain SN15 / ATCC MYA-4574 / FGSC 10173) TaxID=321614 RepID=A0A7U2NPG9_PHANO|nr:hypothetical protein JI435_422650 [Parastagonospora nodorum SN15]
MANNLTTRATPSQDFHWRHRTRCFPIIESDQRMPLLIVKCTAISQANRRVLNGCTTV